LKGTFKNRFPVIFVNDEAMQHTLDQKIRELRQTGYKGQITFYASNYADLLAIDHWTHFHETFLPFFEQYDNVLLESRTKSVNISGLKQLALQREQPFQNTEIAFSLSPEIITTTYEKKTAPLAHKLAAIQELLTLGYRVGLRFLPLLPLEGYQQLYRALIQQVQASIDINAIASLFIAPLLYHKEDFKRLKKQYATTPLQQDFPFLDFLQEREQGLMKMEEAYYRDFEQLFSSAFPTHHIQRDYQ
jgi:spore photoproduct lyase